MTRYVLRTVCLLVGGGFAGGVCAFLLERDSVVTGFVFGLALALGIPIIHFFCRNRLTRGEPVKWKVVILASVISGVIGGVGVSLLSRWSPLALLHMMGFSVVLHLAYQTRWKFGSAGLLVAGVLALAFCFFSAQVLGVVFAVFWLAAVALFDPAWSFKRWKSIWPGKVVEGQACALKF